MTRRQLIAVSVGAILVAGSALLILAHLVSRSARGGAEAIARVFQGELPAGMGVARIDSAVPEGSVVLLAGVPVADVKARFHLTREEDKRPLVAVLARWRSPLPSGRPFELDQIIAWGRKDISETDPIVITLVSGRTKDGREPDGYVLFKPGLQRVTLLLDE